MKLRPVCKISRGTSLREGDRLSTQLKLCEMQSLFVVLGALGMIVENELGALGISLQVTV